MRLESGKARSSKPRTGTLTTCIIESTNLIRSRNLIRNLHKLRIMMELLSINRARMIRQVKKEALQMSGSGELWAGAIGRLMFTKLRSMLVAPRACEAKPYHSTRSDKVLPSQRNSKNELRPIRA